MKFTLCILLLFSLVAVWGQSQYSPIWVNIPVTYCQNFYNVQIKILRYKATPNAKISYREKHIILFPDDSITVTIVGKDSQPVLIPLADLIISSPLGAPYCWQKIPQHSEKRSFSFCMNDLQKEKPTQYVLQEYNVFYFSIFIDNNIEKYCQMSFSFVVKQRSLPNPQ